MNYLQWLAKDTQSCWWCDSADPAELGNSMANGAVGVTTNPVLVSQSLRQYTDVIEANWSDICASPNKAEATIKVVTQQIAKRFEKIYEETQGINGYVCAQVNPHKASDETYMMENAIRISGWAKNISVKIPATAAGIRVIERCAGMGMNITGTVSFTCAQAIAIAEAFERGNARALTPAKMCNSVLMVGRLDDYIRDVVRDRNIDIPEEAIIQCGTAAIKRAYGILSKRDSIVRLMPAGTRGAYHINDLAGASMRMSIHPKIQGMVLKTQDFQARIDEPVSRDVLDTLCTVDEFVKAYEPDGLAVDDFIGYGATQRTLAQFCEMWNLIEAYQL